MDAKRTERQSYDAEIGFRQQPSAMPGRGGLVRIKAAFLKTVGGLKEGLRTQAPIKEEMAIACNTFPPCFFLAPDSWTWLALIATLLLVLSIEFLNTAVDGLCNHIQPEKLDSIRITKDLASAGVFFALLLVALVWIAAAAARLAL